ncbi:hypothetical protein BH09BAC1_BH09BAC1_11250 [soil metagenome]
MEYLPKILLYLFIVNLGTDFGAGLYETRIVLPLWFTKIPGKGYTVNTGMMNQLDTGRKFWGMVTTLPLTLLTIANLVLAIQTPAGPQHDWWLAAAIVTLVERLATFAFFIPTAIQLSKANTLPQAKVHQKVSHWIVMNNVRSLLTLVGLLLALRALAGW